MWISQLFFGTYTAGVDHGLLLCLIIPPLQVVYGHILQATLYQGEHL